MPKRKRMAAAEVVTLESFCEGIISFALNEYTKIRCNCEPLPRETRPFFRNVGKAVTLFGLINQRKVTSTMLKIRKKVFSSPYIFDNFVNHFADGYFHSLDLLPREYFLTAILTFCGIIASMADFCFRRNKFQFAQACIDNLETELEVCLEDIHNLGGWVGLQETASRWAESYDLLNDTWNKIEAQENELATS